MSKHIRTEPSRYLGPLNKDMTAHWDGDSRLREMDRQLKANMKDAFGGRNPLMNGNHRANRPQKRKPRGERTFWMEMIY